MNLRHALVLICLSTACSRSFSQPSAVGEPPRLSLVSVDGMTDGDGVLQGAVLAPSGDDTRVVRGAVHIVVAQASGAPLQSVDFWTPGKQHAAAYPDDLSWDVETTNIFPLGGVMTVTVTPYDAAGNPAAPLYESFIVDNAAPTVVVTSPAQNVPLAPGPLTVHLCAADRTADTQVTLSVNGIAATPEPAAGLGCFEVPGLDAEPGGEGVLQLSIVATDDIGNSRTTAWDVPVTRVLADVDFEAPVVAQLQGWSTTAVALHGALFTVLDESSVNGLPYTVAAWALVDGGRIEHVDPNIQGAVGVPGSEGLAVGFGLVEDGGAQLVPMAYGVPQASRRVSLGINAQGGSGFAYDAAHGAACLSSWGISGSGKFLSCFFADGGSVDGQLQPAANPSELFAMLISGSGQLLISEGDFADPALQRYDLSNGLTYLASDTVPSLVQCIEDASGALCFENSATPAHVDETGAVALLPQFDDGGAELSYVAATPTGGLAGIPRSTALVLDLAEFTPDGGDGNWGCMPLEQQSYGVPAAYVDGAGEFFLAYVDFDQVTFHVEAFSSANRLAWTWSTVSNKSISARPTLVLDESDPQSPLWVVFAETGRAVALSRRNPSQLPTTDACAP